MPLNKSNGNMYDWVTNTWNPLGGECPHHCKYCSTNKLMRYPGIKAKYSGDVKLIEKELKIDLGHDKTIFVCAQHDLFAESVPDEYIRKILDHCRGNLNNYLFQTKNPERILNYRLPNNSVVCTTIETNRWYEQMGDAPLPLKRAEAMMAINHYHITYVTIEPIMDFDLFHLAGLIDMCKPVQVNIGADSGKNNLPEPTKGQILELIEVLEKFTTVKQKSNLARLMK